jgi:hypothetical protein
MKNHTKKTPFNINESNTTETKKIVFDESKINEFNTLIKNTIQNLNTLFDENKTVDEKTSILTKYLQENSACIFGKVIKINSHNRQHKKPQWFDSTCKNAKDNFKHAKNAFNKSKTDANRHNFIQHRTKYNDVRRKAKHRYRVVEGARLTNIA